MPDFDKLDDLLKDIEKNPVKYSDAFEGTIKQECPMCGEIHELVVKNGNLTCRGCRGTIKSKDCKWEIT